MHDHVRRALTVGNSDYPAGQLRGCVEDARSMAQLLRRHHDGAVNFDVEVLTSDEVTVTKARLRERVAALLRQPADVALLYFTGHGSEDDAGGHLVTTDASEHDPGVALGDVLALANRATHIGEVVIIVDSCHGGWLGSIPATGTTHAQLREGLSILTASRAAEVAYEEQGGGVFTKLVRSALEGGAADVLGHVSVAGVYAHVSQALGAWDQRPLFKSHVARMLTLRRAPPAVPLATLRRLPEWFPEDDAVFPLSPRNEPTADPPDEHAEATFRCLQQGNRAKLVEPVGEEDMYWAAIRATGCRLTTLGRFYRRLAADGRI
jgi:uncharacterized caspase-like protein